MCTLDDNHNLLFFAIDDEQIKNELLIYLNEVKRKMFISRMSNRKKKFNMYYRKTRQQQKEKNPMRYLRWTCTFI